MSEPPDLPDGELAGLFLVTLIVLALLTIFMVTIHHTEDQAPAPPAGVTATTPLGPRGPASVSGVVTFPDGKWEVGQDIGPGRYKAVIPESGVNHEYDCYWARLRTRSEQSIITNRWRIMPGTETVTIKKQDGYFTSSGCGLWVRQT